MGEKKAGTNKNTNFSLCSIKLSYTKLVLSALSFFLTFPRSFSRQILTGELRSNIAHFTRDALWLHGLLEDEEAEGFGRIKRQNQGFDLETSLICLIIVVFNKHVNQLMCFCCLVVLGFVVLMVFCLKFAMCFYIP